MKDEGAYESGSEMQRQREELKRRERDKHKNALSARQKMIRRMGPDKENAKEKTESGTSKIPLWSN